MNKKPIWPTPWKTWTGLSLWDADGHIVAEIGIRGSEEDRMAVGKFIVNAVNAYATSTSKAEDA